MYFRWVLIGFWIHFGWDLGRFHLGFWVEFLVVFRWFLVGF